MFQAIFDFLFKIILYLLVFVTFTIFWSIPRGQSFYIQLTYNSFTIEALKSEKLKKYKNKKTGIGILGIIRQNIQPLYTR